MTRKSGQKEGNQREEKSNSKAVEEIEITRFS